MDFNISNYKSKVDKEHYEELRQLCINLYDWCIYHGKVFTKEDKEKIFNHRIEF